MDCQTAIEYINLYVDNMLGDVEVKQLLSHIRSCSSCEKELKDAQKLKKALSSLPELEPPAGLALSALKKAKKRRLPIFAYASAGVAAVVALLAIFSSSIFPGASESRDENSVAYTKSMAEEAAPEIAAAPAATGAPGEQSDMFLMEAPSNNTEGLESGGEGFATQEPAAGLGIVSIVVPAESSDSFRDKLDSFITKNGIKLADRDISSNMEFSVPENNVEELKSLISKAGITYEGEITAGCTVNFVFNQ